jgi:hypothetical protein
MTAPNVADRSGDVVADELHAFAVGTEAATRLADAVLAFLQFVDRAAGGNIAACRNALDRTGDYRRTKERSEYNRVSRRFRRGDWTTPLG